VISGFLSFFSVNMWRTQSSDGKFLNLNNAGAKVLLRLEGLDCFEELRGSGHVVRGEDNRVSADAVDAWNI
jgi:hypothetical protein